RCGQGSLQPAVLLPPEKLRAVDVHRASPPKDLPQEKQGSEYTFPDRKQGQSTLSPNSTLTPVCLTPVCLILHGAPASNRLANILSPVSCATTGQNPFARLRPFAPLIVVAPTSSTVPSRESPLAPVNGVPPVPMT